MTYAEKYVNKEYVVNNTEEFSNEFMKWIKKQNKSFYVDIDKMGELLIKFLQQEIKPVLSDDEKAILRNIEFKDYMIIGRKESGDLYVNDKEKDSFNGTWFIMFKKHLFQFIKPRRRI